MQILSLEGLPSSLIDFIEKTKPEVASWIGEYLTENNLDIYKAVNEACFDQQLSSYSVFTLYYLFPDIDWNRLEIRYCGTLDVNGIVFSSEEKEAIIRDGIKYLPLYTFYFSH